MIRRIIQQELGVSVEDVFASVDARPLATASIAQVHAAVLKGSNKDVVIKVCGAYHLVQGSGLRA